MESEIKGFSTFLVVLFGLMLFFNSVGTISAGERGILFQFGAVQRVLGEGLYFKIPFIQGVKSMDITVQKNEVEASAASKDLQVVSAVIALNYRLDPDNVGKLWQEVGKNYDSKILDPAIQEAVKASTAKFTAEELITKRELVKEDMKSNIIERVAGKNIIIDTVNIVNFDFSPEFNRAIEAKVTAEQSALAAKNKLEQVKFEAEQRVSQAKGEAEAIRIQVEAINKQGGEAYVGLKAIEKWNGVLPEYMLGETMPFINIK